MKKFAAMVLGLVITLWGIDRWAGTLTPPIQMQERLTLNDTFYEQHTQLDSVFQTIAAQKGPKVVGIGDSTMYGAAVNANETIPYFLRQQVQANVPTAQVYNLAYPGARPADLYAMEKEAAAAHPDLMVIDVNVVFFSERILQEGALANKTLKRDFIFEPYVPKGIFTDNRVEEAATEMLKDTNIGQNKAWINKLLFQQAPRQYVSDWAKDLQPPAVQPAKPQAGGAAAPTEDVIKKPWKQKPWGAAEQQNMARIYGQGALTEANDSVQMLHKMAAYAKDHQLKVLFYLTPQNETLIGKFFSLDTLRQKEDYLLHLLQQEGAWVVDLRGTAQEDDFADYDHMLKSGNRRVADALYETMREAGVVAK